MEKIESSVKIYFSNSYGDFKFLKGNRDINENKVEKIMKAIQEEDIDILKFAPIIVDEEFRILDGQHRFYVAKKLKRPVYYVQVPNMGVREIAKINSNSSNWKVRDYLNSYIDMGIESYQKIQDLNEKYGMTPLNLAALIHMGTLNAKGTRETFIDGDVRMICYDQAVTILKILEQFKPHTKQPYSRRFCTAIERLLKSKLYDHQLMIKKLQLSGQQIDRLDSTKTIIAQMEEIVNFKAQKQIRLL